MAIRILLQISSQDSMEKWVSWHCPPIPGTSESSSSNILESFYYGRAVAEVLTEKISSALTMVLSEIGQASAEQGQFWRYILQCPFSCRYPRTSVDLHASMTSFHSLFIQLRLLPAGYAPCSTVTRQCLEKLTLHQYWHWSWKFICPVQLLGPVWLAHVLQNDHSLSSILEKNVCNREFQEEVDARVQADFSSRTTNRSVQQTSSSGQTNARNQASQGMQIPSLDLQVSKRCAYYIILYNWGTSLHSLANTGFCRQPFMFLLLRPNMWSTRLTKSYDRAKWGKNKKAAFLVKAWSRHACAGGRRRPEGRNRHSSIFNTSLQECWRAEESQKRDPTIVKLSAWCLLRDALQASPICDILERIDIHSSPGTWVCIQDSSGKSFMFRKRDWVLTQYSSKWDGAWEAVYRVNGLHC